jgi:DNA polymerase III delta subunit
LDKDITPTAVQLLIFFVGTQLSDLIGQIKIITNNYSDQNLIDTTEVEQVTSIYLSQDIFEFANCLGRKRLDKSIFIIHNLLKGGVSPQQIISQLLRHFSILWQIKGYHRKGIRSNSIISKELKIYAKYFDEYAEQSIKWHSESLKKVFGILCSIDKENRDTGIRPEISLDILSRQIINC